MKTPFGIWNTVALLLVNVGLLHGAPGNVGQQPPGQTVNVPPPTPYAVTVQDGNSRVWERTVYELAPDGTVVPKKHHYTELATGLNYRQNGQWVPSKEEIDIQPDGTASATQGQHQAYFPGDIYQGQIKLVTPDGLQLYSRPVGLSYDDGNNTVMIAVLTNSVGQVLGTNQVIYTNAFTGINADLLYTYTKAGFEQDIVLREQPPTPESLGLNADTARLQVLTEFFSPPQPTIQTTTSPAQAGLSLTDQNLVFGAMQMIQGRAFLLGQNATDAGASVSKQWVQVNGRQFLVEEVPVDAIVDGLAALPLTAMNTGSGKASHTASKHLQLPPQRVVKNTSKAVKLAKAKLPARGFVLDYQTINSNHTNYTFQGDTTYFISKPLLLLYGTNTFEGGAVLKYTNNAYMSYLAININASAYHPVIFTAMDDNSVGENISGSTGNPTNYYATYALYPTGSNTNNSIQNMRFAYAHIPIFATGTVNLTNVQIINCQTGVELTGMYQSGTLNLRNVLMANVLTDFNLNLYDASALISAQNVTFANPTNSSAYSFITQAASVSYAMNATNCILANMNFSNVISHLSGGYNGFYPAYPTFGSSYYNTYDFPFQSVGGGNYYLTNGSQFRNAGTTNLAAGLWADIQTRTTYPPILYNVPGAYFSTSLNLSPQVQRDNSGAPDLGYHYDPLDYIFGGMYVTNATITVNPGTAVAFYGTNSQAYGLAIADNAQFLSQGLADNLNRMVEYSAVQEQAPAGWEIPSYGFLAHFNGTDSSIYCHFTDFSVMAQDANHFQVTSSIFPFSFQDCQFHGGLMTAYYATVNLTNCLLERVNADLEPSDDNVPVIRNNLIWGGIFNFSPVQTNSIIKDNLFDRASIPDNLGGLGNTYNGGNNAFVTNCDRLDPTFASDVILTNSLNYQTGPLGDYYQPTNSPLINKGSTTADQVGLYHYTVTTNEVVEGTNVVSIGYHYVAVDTNGVPIDTNGDGIPDYLEDANGNGLIDSGEIGWNITGDLGLQVIITRPRNGSTLP